VLTYVAHAAYALMVIAFLARDVLHLRTLLVAAQGGIVIYAWFNGVLLVSGWNMILAVVNAAMVVRILHDRRAVELPAELKPLYERHFSALTPPEFLGWWRRGRRETVYATRLAHAGQHPEALYFLLAGKVRVSRNDVTITELPHGYFVAEMSLLTGDHANADVDAEGAVELISWRIDALHELRLRNPSLWTKIQSVIGHDLVEKIRLGESRPTVVTTAQAGA
jgi:CRP-like cAMP-binding protein